VIDKNIVDDLDAIYFSDKIDMRAHSVSHTNIPKLDLNFAHVSGAKKKVDENNKEIGQDNKIDNNFLQGNGNGNGNNKKPVAVKYYIFNHIL
jgi:hypothetical protein